MERTERQRRIAAAFEGPRTIDTQEARDRARRALLHAADQIGSRAGNDPKNYTRIGRGKKAHTQFNPPKILRVVIDASCAVSDGSMSVNDAMALIGSYDVELARFGKVL